MRTSFAASAFGLIVTFALALMPLASARADVGYGYDELGRVICSVAGNGTKTTYNYDAAGNRTQQTITANGGACGQSGGGGTNNPPTANNDSYSTNQGVAKTVDPRTNDTDPDGDTLTITGVSQGTQAGAVAFTGTSVTYTPQSTFNGTETFTYTISDGHSHSATATVTMTIGNSPPVAVADAYSTPQGVAKTFDPKTNDSDPDGDTLTITAVTQGNQGGTVNPNGGVNITYTPLASFSGTETFTYTISDGNLHSATATVTMTINPNQPPVAVNDTASTPHDTTVNIYARNNDTDPDGDTITIIGRTDPQHGSTNIAGTDYLIYTPAAGYSGTDSFQYTISDGHNHTATATVTVTVVATAPVANPVSQTVAYNSTNNPITLNVTGGAPTSVAVASAASHGTATASGTSITYTPTSGYSGADSFTYTATNNGGTSAAATVSITVNGQLPTANGVSASVVVNTTSNPVTLNITGGTATSVAVGTQAAHGTATANGTTITYTPAANYAGADSFTYTASNTYGTSAPATASITVAAAAIPPVAVTDNVTVAFNSTNNAIYSMTNDTDAPYNYPLTIIGRDDPSHGSTNIAGTAYLQYTPTTGYSGPDSFHYWISDGHGNQVMGTVNVTVSVQTTVAGPVSATVAYNSTSNPITLNISGGAATSVAVGTQASHGTATASGTSITYTPTSGYSGSDSFTYTATNSSGTSAPGTVTVTVTAQAPVANTVNATVAYNAINAPITLNITGGAATSVSVNSQGSHGTATASGTSITYSPTTGYSGADSFTYKATNNGGTSAAATVNVTVSVQTPVANTVSAGVVMNTTGNPISLNITGGTATSVAVGTQASHGTATASGTSITYTPTNGYSGADSFTYTASNTGGSSAAATVNITVSAAAQPPVANTDNVSVAYGSANNAIYSMTNDTDPYGYPLIITGRDDPSHGSTNIAGNAYLLYTPASGYYGSDQFHYWISDQHGNQVMGTVNVTVNPSPPSVGNVSATVGYNSSNTNIPLSVNTGGVPTTVTVSSQAQHGTATANAMTISYTPNSGYSGPDSFSYTATNAGGTSSAATASITVSGPAGPTAHADTMNVPDYFYVTQGYAVGCLDTRTNDTSPSGYALTISSVTQPTPYWGGQSSTDGNQVCYYSPYYGSFSDTFTYTISDGHGGQSTATVTVNVTAQ